MIGYIYAPEVPESIDLYYGEEIWYKFYFFMSGSFVATFCLYFWLNRKMNKSYRFCVVRIRAPRWALYYRVLSAVLCGGMVLTIIFFKDRLTYVVDIRDNLDLLIGLFFRFVAYLGLVSWMLFRSGYHSRRERKADLITALLAIGLFCYVEMKMGTRSPILGLLIGLFFFELSPIYYTVRKSPFNIILLVFLAIPILWLFIGLTYARYIYGSPSLAQVYEVAKISLSMVSSDNLKELIFAQDYFFPAMPLFVAIEKNFIDMKEVLISNLANSIILLKYPTITATLMKDHLGPVDRQIGFALHLFVEGFVAAGWLGILYNAIIWNAGIRMWQYFAKSDNLFFNKCIHAILATQLFIGMRAQSSNFIKSLWLQILPAALLLLLAMRCKIGAIHSVQKSN